MRNFPHIRAFLAVLYPPYKQKVFHLDKKITKSIIVMLFFAKSSLLGSFAKTESQKMKTVALTLDKP